MEADRTQYGLNAQSQQFWAAIPMVDLLPEITGVEFDQAWKGRVEAVVDEQTGVRAFFISAKDLITYGEEDTSRRLSWLRHEEDPSASGKRLNE